MTVSLLSRFFSIRRPFRIRFPLFSAQTYRMYGRKSILWND